MTTRPPLAEVKNAGPLVALRPAECPETVGATRYF